MGEIKRFYYQIENTSFLKIPRGQKILPILWNCNGMYVLIPMAFIQNELTIQKNDPIMIRWYDFTKQFDTINPWVVRRFLDGQE